MTKPAPAQARCPALRLSCNHFIVISHTDHTTLSCPLNKHPVNNQKDGNQAAVHSDQYPEEKTDFSRRREARYPPVQSMFCTDSAVAGCTANAGFPCGTGIACCLQAALLYQPAPADFASLPSCWSLVGGQPPRTLSGSILAPPPCTPRAEHRVPRLHGSPAQGVHGCPARPSEKLLCPLLSPGPELHTALSPFLPASFQDHVQSCLRVFCCCSHSSRAQPVARITPGSWALSRGAQERNPLPGTPLAIGGKSMGVPGDTGHLPLPRGLGQQHPAKAPPSNARGEGLGKCLAALEGSSPPSSAEGPAAGTCPVPPAERDCVCP